MTIEQKYNDLKGYLRDLGSVAIAYSGGVDSTFLLKAAHEALGDGVIAVTARSCLFPERELDEATAFCEKEGIVHVIQDTNELEIEGFAKNWKLNGVIGKIKISDGKSLRKMKLTK